MDKVYIDKEDLAKYKATYELFNKLFKGKGLIPIDDLIAQIEDMDADIELLQENYRKLEEEYEEYRRDNPVRY